MIPPSVYEYHDVLLAAGYVLTESEGGWEKRPFIGHFCVERRWYTKLGARPGVYVWWPSLVGRWSAGEWKVKRAYALARAHSLRKLKEAGIGEEAFEVAKVLGVCP